MFVFGIITAETFCFRKKEVQNNEGRKKGRGIFQRDLKENKLQMTSSGRLV